MIARVRGVSASSIRSSSMLRVSGRMSTKTGTAPRNAIALAHDEKVKDGTITSSPGPRSSRRQASSSAAVPEQVSSALAAPVRASIRARARLVTTPPPARLREASTAASAASSPGARDDSENGTIRSGKVKPWEADVGTLFHWLPVISAHVLRIIAELNRGVHVDLRRAHGSQRLTPPKRQKTT